MKSLLQSSFLSIFFFFQEIILMHIHVKKKRISWRNPHKIIKFHHDLVFQILVEREIKVEKNILTFLTKSKFKKAKKKIIFTKKNSKNPVVHNRSKVQTNFGGGVKNVLCIKINTFLSCFILYLTKSLKKMQTVYIWYYH